MPMLGIMASAISGNLSTYAYDSIATATVTSGGTSSITFSGIPATYTHLQIRGIVSNSDTTAESWGYIQLNSDTTANYRSHNLQGNGATATAYASAATTYLEEIITFPGNGGTSVFGVCVIDILDYTSTSKAKTIKSLSGSDRNGSGSIHLASGLYFATPAAVTSITIANPSTLTFDTNSSFALYGIK